MDEEATDAAFGMVAISTLCHWTAAKIRRTDDSYSLNALSEPWAELEITSLGLVRKAYGA
jgi:hypothetical protein